MNPPPKSCTKPYCFFCAMKEPNTLLRRRKLAKCFSKMPFIDDKKHVLVLSSLWNLAMNQPNDPEFPSLGIFECMANFIRKGINNKDWLLKDQNIYIPYYAAHIIGSYAMNKSKLAKKAANSGVILPLLELLRGKMSWIEQRVAVRALGHLASHSQSFKKLINYEEYIVGMAMKMASNCLKVIYDNFVRKKETERLKYQCDLLTRGVGGLEFENRKAEEWASQLQCWCISLLDCFVKRERCISLITSSNQTNFLEDLCRMWGGLVNKNSPCGIGLIRSLCYTRSGRESVASSKEVILSLCNTSRSSDNWQYMAVESLLLILKDSNVRYKVLDEVVYYLKDLVELSSVKGRKKVGDTVTQVLLQDYGKIKYGQLILNEGVERVLKEIWDIKVERKKREKLMDEEEIKQRKCLATKMKKEGNKLFWGGDIEGGLLKYTKALNLCPLKYRKERIVLFSNRAQCYLLLKNSENVISDTTRALCLSSKGNNNNLHSKSLWRRSQAYDMIGLAKESLLDCLLFLHCNNNYKSKGRKRFSNVPYYVARLISKQVHTTWLFAAIDSNSQYDHLEEEVCSGS